MLRTSPAVTPLTRTARPTPSAIRAPAYLSVRLFRGDIDQYEIYPIPSKVTKAATFLTGRKRQEALFITPYIDVPRQLLEETGLFSKIVDVTNDQKQIPIGNTEHFLIKLDLANDTDIHWFRNDLLKHPLLTGLLFCWLPYRNDQTITIRAYVRRWDGESKTYTASASAAAYYYNWSWVSGRRAEKDTKAAEENLRKLVIDKSVAILQQQMLDDTLFYRDDRTVKKNEKAEQSHEATQESAPSASP